ncbi:MAG: alpha/beta hydrolase [Jatrophihabitantaceae bacterium]
MSRRTLLLGSLGVIGVAALGTVGVDRGTLQSGGGGLPDGVPDVASGRMVSGSFVSARRGGLRTGWTIAYPPGHDGAGLPVLVSLHGRGGDHDSTFERDLYLDRFLADAVRHGTKPFAIASVDGGNTYWHRRRGSDSGGMVVDEFLPLLARHGLDTTRIGLFGWSMGGYGALYLASALGRQRVPVVVAESPAIWHQAGQSAPGAFDDAADFDAHSIFGRLDGLAGIALRIDCGASDGFAPATRDLRAALHPIPAGGIEPGSHDATYWRRMAPAQLRFAGAHLPG